MTTKVERDYEKIDRLIGRFIAIEAADGTLHDRLDVFGRIIRSTWRVAVLAHLADGQPTDAEIRAAIVHAMRPTIGERVRAYFAEAFADAMERGRKG